MTSLLLWFTETVCVSLRMGKDNLEAFPLFTDRRRLEVQSSKEPSGESGLPTCTCLIQTGASLSPDSGEGWGAPGGAFLFNWGSA